MSEKTKYRLNIGDRYLSDAQGNLYCREPLKDMSGFTDTAIANFTPELKQLTRRDNGFQVVEKILFQARRNGQYEPPVEIEKKDLIGTQRHAKFSPGCLVWRGKGNCAKLGEMMGLQCVDAETRTIYEHTGWRIIDGERVFLNGDFSVTATGLTDCFTVELPPDLARCYRFIPCEDSPAECFKTLLERMPRAAPDWLIIPSLAYVFM